MKNNSSRDLLSDSFSEHNYQDRNSSIYFDMEDLKDDQGSLFNSVDVKQSPINLPIVSPNQDEFQKFLQPKLKKKKSKDDFRKNICGYITKKVISQYCSPRFQQKVNDLCHKYCQCQLKTNCCCYLHSIQYYKSIKDDITGPSHLDMLFYPSNKSVKGSFKQFYFWFLKQRYIRYVILEGKMKDPSAYLQYKNKQLMNIQEWNNRRLK